MTSLPGGNSEGRADFTGMDVQCKVPWLVKVKPLILGSTLAILLHSSVAVIKIGKKKKNTLL